MKSRRYTRVWICHHTDYSAQSEVRWSWRTIHFRHYRGCGSGQRTTCNHTDVAASFSKFWKHNICVYFHITQTTVSYRKTRPSLVHATIFLLKSIPLFVMGVMLRVVIFVYRFVYIVVSLCSAGAHGLRFRMYL